jgi:hypothetical protein
MCPAKKRHVARVHFGPHNVVSRLTSSPSARMYANAVINVACYQVYEWIWLYQRDEMLKERVVEVRICLDDPQQGRRVKVKIKALQKGLSQHGSQAEGVKEDESCFRQLNEIRLVLHETCINNVNKRMRPILDRDGMRMTVSGKANVIHVKVLLQRCQHAD